MDTVSFVRERLSAMGWKQYRAIFEATGVPRHTIRNIAIGKTQNPRHNTLEALRVYLEQDRAA